MDTITHALMGRLAGTALLPKDADKTRLVNWMTALAALPDADFLYSLGNPFKFLLTHRGITHAFYGVAVLALGAAWLMWRKKRSRPFGYFWGVAAATMLGCHVLYDWVTSYGTQLLAPFSRERFALDWLFILDPYVDAVLIVGLLLRSKWPVAPRLALAAVIAYTTTMGLFHHQAVTLTRQRAEREGYRPVEVAALPTPFSPLHWRGIVTLDDAFYILPITLLGATSESSESYPRAGTSETGVWQALWQDNRGSLYRWFARFPTVEEIDVGDGRRLLTLTDQQFVVDLDNLGWLAQSVLAAIRWLQPTFQPNPPFQLQVLLGHDGRIEGIMLGSL